MKMKTIHISYLAEARSFHQTWAELVSWELWITVRMLRGWESSSPTLQTFSAMVMFNG